MFDPENYGSKENQKEFLKILLPFLKEAGKIAVENQESVNRVGGELKESEDVGTIVTKTDLAVTELFDKTLSEKMPTKDYAILGEESMSAEGNAFELLKKGRFTFVLDPIDGTNPYKLGMSSYGISVGVLLDGKPLMGAVYCPAEKQLVYNVAEESFYTKNPFTKKAKTEALTPGPAKSPLVCDTPWRGNVDGTKVDLKKSMMVNYYSSVYHMMLLATKQAKAKIFGVFLWDMAGAWPVVKNMGLDVYRLSDGKKVESFSKRFFNEHGDSNYLFGICRKEDLPELQAMVKDSVKPRDQGTHVPLEEKITNKEWGELQKNGLGGKGIKVTRVRHNGR